MGRLDGKVAIVTGASRGVGAATARVFAEEGAQVMVTDVVDDRGEQVARDIGDAATYAHCDVSVESDWAALMARTMDRHGRLDVLANVAAVIFLGLIEETTPDDYLRVTRVNELGTFMGIRAAIEPMTASGGGSIINYASVWVVQPAPYTCAYGASKWAVSGMTKCAAIELAPRGIRVNCIYGSGGSLEFTFENPIAEPMQRRLAAAQGGGAARPMRPRPYTGPGAEYATGAEAAARTCLFLASDESSWFNGADFGPGALLIGHPL
jgi:3alpha(or 20beta)-hydroxysteroid dehydrogenase